MNREEFVNGIKLNVDRASATGVVNQLVKPAGRKPHQKDVEISDWFNGLNVEDKEMVQRVISETSNAATFGFLCVLDGVRTVTDTAGELELYFNPADGTNNIYLNDFDGEFLHDLFILSH